MTSEDENVVGVGADGDPALHGSRCRRWRSATSSKPISSSAAPASRSTRTCSGIAGVEGLRWSGRGRPPNRLEGGAARAAATDSGIDVGRRSGCRAPRRRGCPARRRICRPSWIRKKADALAVGRRAEVDGRWAGAARCWRTAGGTSRDGAVGRHLVAAQGVGEGRDRRIAGSSVKSHRAVARQEGLVGDAVDRRRRRPVRPPPELGSGATKVTWVWRRAPALRATTMKSPPP